MSAHSPPRGARRAHLAGPSWPVVYIPIGRLSHHRHRPEVDDTQAGLGYGPTFVHPSSGTLLGRHLLRAPIDALSSHPQLASPSPSAGRPSSHVASPRSSTRGPGTSRGRGPSGFAVQ